MEAKQGYLKGMDQDTSNNKRSPESYYSADNFRVVTEDGSSTGALEVEKGTKIGFKVPDLAEMTLKDGTIIPAQTDLKIVGSTTMVDTIIIFTTAETSSTPSGYGQIWKMKFDETSGKIIGLAAGNFLDPNTHLVYNQALNFSTEYRIGRAIAVYENELKQRVYWTDNYNPVRVFNLADPDTLNVPLATVNIFPGANLTQPVIKSIGAGSLVSGTQIQFTYKLLNVNGGETTYAPPTPLYALPFADVTDGGFSGFNGEGISNNRSVTYELTGLDTSYDAIKHVAIVYDSNGNMSAIWEFAEDNVPATGELTVVCSTLSNALEILPEEYAIVEYGFDRCKDIEVQGNRLVAANIKLDKFNLDFDARAYRFNPSQQALLKDSADPSLDVTLIGPNPTWTDVPEEHDAINVFNKEQTATWFDPNEQYKYKADGVTLGGEGANISYEFTSTAMTGATSSTFDTATNAPTHVTVSGTGPNAAPIYKGVLRHDGTPQPTYIQNQIDNMAGPWAHSNFTGYARGELYRFGIVFYNKQGVPSFVQWIGDIKFPDVADGFPLSQMNGNVLELNQLGIKFNVDVSSIAAAISGYSIVRLERSAADRTRLATGYHMYFNYQYPAINASLFHLYYMTGVNNNPAGLDPSKPFPVTNELAVVGGNEQIIHLPDRPGENFLVRTYNTFYRMGFLISPFGSVYQQDHSDNDYLETLGYYKSNLHNYYQPASTAESDASYAFYYKMSNFALPTHNLERWQIDKAINLYPGELRRKSNDFLDNIKATSSSFTQDGNLGNVSYGREPALFVDADRENHPFGIGQYKRAFMLRMNTGMTGEPTIAPSIPHMDGTYLGLNKPNYESAVSGQPENSWYGPTFANSNSPYFGGGQACITDFAWKLVGYRRYLDNQYGGDTYEVRSTDSYTYIGHYQTLKNSAAQTLEFDVYGGDTYVNYYDSEYMERYNSNDNQNQQGTWKSPNINKLGIAVCGPIESPVNTNYRTSRLWYNERDSSDIDFYSSNSNDIYAAWNTEDEVQAQFFSEDFLSQYAEQFQAQLWASDVKIYGELTDSWRSFPVANKIDVDGIYGPINRIISFQDNLMFYQDRAVGIASLDERSVIQDDSGQELVLGTGGVFPDYKYISTTTGSVHQFDVVASENGVYHWDARLRKLFKFAGGTQPISDIKGMSSFFDANVIGDISTTDKTLRESDEGFRTGVHGTYDPRYNRVLFTFLNTKEGQELSEFFVEGEKEGKGSYVLTVGDYVIQNGVLYYVNEDFTIPTTNPPTTPDLSTYEQLTETVNKSFTISFNEFTNSFESFYDFLPGMYLEYGRRLMSVSPLARNEMHVHNEGKYGQYYDNIFSVSKLHTKFTAHPEITKIFNNIAFMSELYTSQGVDVYNETVDRMRFFSNYQDTGTIDLTVNTNIKRRMRTWRAVIPRDKSNPLSRMRNSWLDCILEYDNTDNKRLILQDIMYSFTPTKL